MSKWFQACSNHKIQISEDIAYAGHKYMLWMKFSSIILASTCDKTMPAES